MCFLKVVAPRSHINVGKAVNTRGSFHLASQCCAQVRVVPWPATEVNQFEPWAFSLVC